MTGISIQGYELRDDHAYARWTDCRGLQHETEHELALEHCRNGAYGLTAKDVAQFREAHDRFLLELELGRPLASGRLHRLESES